MRKPQKYRTYSVGGRAVIEQVDSVGPVEPVIVRLMNHLRRRPAMATALDTSREVRVVRPGQRYQVFCDRDLPGDRP